MARPRKAEQKPITADDIKAAARRQMAEHGTAGLSLRAIARELGITAPAIYNYFPRLDDLITALIVDAFTALAEALEAAGAPARGRRAGLSGQFADIVRAYRAWAVAHPTDFQLIYGNPIPGYTAPAALTAPLAARPFQQLLGLLQAGWNQGLITVPAAYQPVPKVIAKHLKEFQRAAGLNVPDAVICLLTSGWARIHGQVFLELHQHVQPLIGDPAAFYELELRAYLSLLGLPPPE